MNFKIEELIANIGIKELNDMQKQVVAAPREHDLLLLSPTGSGKTLAYILAMLPFVDKGGEHPKTLVISPSRELAMQSQSVFSSLKSGAKSLCCYGGHSLGVEKRSLLAGADVVFATPGRLLDHLNTTYIDGASVECIVIDEFDKLVEMGFSEEVSSIIEATKNRKKIILTSATESKMPKFLALGRKTTINMLGSAIPDITMKRIITTGDDLQHVAWLLSTIEGRSTVIFCNFREDVEMVGEFLSEKGIVNDYFHGGMQQSERERKICKFRNGSSNILISTDLAARGIDILTVDNIIHFHAPQTWESLVHRNGRTARIGAKGAAYVIDSRENDLLSGIEVMELESCPIDIEMPKYATIYIGKGKKDKVNKIDIVGFLCSEADIKKEDIGDIEVKDFYAYVAVRRDIAKAVVRRVSKLKIKKQRTKIELCR